MKLYDLSSAQLRIVWIGIVSIVASILFPPWKVGMGTYGRSYSGGYAVVFTPPVSATGVDLQRIALQLIAIALVGLCALISVGRGGPQGETGREESRTCKPFALTGPIKSLAGGFLRRFAPLVIIVVATLQVRQLDIWRATDSLSLATVFGLLGANLGALIYALLPGYFGLRWFWILSGSFFATLFLPVFIGDMFIKHVLHW